MLDPPCQLISLSLFVPFLESFGASAVRLHFRNICHSKKLVVYGGIVNRSLILPDADDLEAEW